ncbi:MAG: endonuclease/exonuclease/phosphatase family protein [Bacteroidota bacterium]
MNIKTTLTLIAFFALGAGTLLAGGPRKYKKQVTVAFYNVENLFDLEDDPNKNDNEFLPDGSYQWTEEHLKIKLANLARVIAALGDEDGPEILGLAEVENRRVIEMLCASKALKKHGYEIVHRESPDQRGIDCALIYKKKKFLPLYARTYTVPFPENPDITTRDILLVKGILDKEIEVSFVVNHWSSRRGGAEKSSYKRERAAGILRAVVDSVQVLDPLANIVIMGDMNDEPNNKSVHGILRAGKDSLEARYMGLYNPMYKVMEEGKGTLKYRGEWDLFDQIIVATPMASTGARLHYIDCSAGIYSPSWMAQTDTEGDWHDAPRRSHIRRQFYENGFSDHFPVFIHLEY